MSKSSVWVEDSVVEFLNSDPCHRAMVSRIGNSQIIVADIQDDSTYRVCLLYTSPSPRDRTRSRMPSSA